MLDIRLGAMLPGNEIQGGIKDLPGLGNKTLSAAFPLTFSHLKEIYNQVWGKKAIAEKSPIECSLREKRNRRASVELRAESKPLFILKRSRMKNSEINSWI